MSYSRRQLYAAGEPLGECVTRKEGGRVIYGGGGSAPATQTQITDIPEWAKPTAERNLSKAEALTSDKPYVSYGSWAKNQGLDPNQVAGFTGMQNQAFEGAQNLQPAQGLGVAQGLTGLASMGALGTRYNPYQTGQFGQQAGDYMSPFIQQALDPQLRELSRQSEMQRNMNQAQAVGQGAFGGSRQAIVEAERQRNLGQQQQNVLSQGYQQAFDRAQQQFNTEQQLREQSRQYGAGLGLQGLQTALQGAGQLGNLGAQQFGQQKDIIGLQSQLGAQQQQLDQAKINAQMQNYAAEQKYPYQQLEFMSNILRGTPMGTTQTLFQAPPTMGQTIGSLGMGAYGISQLMKADGGSVSSYADGGSVTSSAFLEAAIRKLSDAQLQIEVTEAEKAGDQGRLALLQEETQRRASARGGNEGAGLSSIFSEQMANNVLPTEESMANGGIVAFAEGDVVDDDEEDTRPTTVGRGNAAIYDQLTGMYPGIIRDIQGATYRDMPEEQYNKVIQKRYDMLSKMAGESPYEGLRKKIDEFDADREQSLSQGRGLAALQAAAAMMQGHGFARGLGQAGGAFAQSYGQALQADRAEKRSLASMKINLADAERKERMGLTRDAIAAADQARKDHADAQGFALKKANALAGVVSKGAAATKPPKPTKGPGPAKGYDALAEAIYQGKIATGSPPGAATRAAAYTEAADKWGKQTGTERTDVTTRGQNVTAFKEAAARVDKQRVLAPAKFKKFAAENHGGNETAAREALILQDMENMNRVVDTLGGAPAPAAARPAVNPNSSRPAANPSTVQGLPPGATVKGNEVFDANGALIGHVTP